MNNALIILPQVTDGSTSLGSTAVLRAAQRLQTTGARVFGIGIGLGRREDQLVNIVSEPEDQFLVRAALELPEIRDEFMSHLAEGNVNA